MCKKFLVCCLCMVLLLCGCSGENLIYELFESDAEKVLDAGRPTNATNLPDFSGDVEDIRITTIPRNVDMSGYENYFGLNVGEIEFRQIYYGYKTNGKWTDLPCENYELVSVINNSNLETGEEKVYYGYEAANQNHIVKIGQYLLFSLAMDESYSVSDSLGSNFQLLFSEYENFPENRKIYGYLREDRDSVVSGWEVKYEAITDFMPRYYLWLKYDEIPKDYELHRVEYYEDREIKVVITYNDIQRLLEKSEK